MTLRLLWNTAFSASPLAGIISMIYGCAFSFFIYDYNDAGNFTFHIYGYSLKKKKNLQVALNSLAGQALPSDSRHQCRPVTVC